VYVAYVTESVSILYVDVAVHNPSLAPFGPFHLQSRSPLDEERICSKALLDAPVFQRKCNVS